MPHWLLKTEPGTYSLEDLEREGTTIWDGVRNPTALRNLGAVAPGDGLVVYHSGRQSAAVGIAEAVGRAYPDPRAGDPGLLVLAVRFTRRLARPVLLAELQTDQAFAGSPLLRQGRLSVVPLTPEQWGRVLELACGRPERSPETSFPRRHGL